MAEYATIMCTRHDDGSVTYKWDGDENKEVGVSWELLIVDGDIDVKNAIKQFDLIETRRTEDAVYFKQRKYLGQGATHGII